jgi:hypothetical protein
VPPERGPSLALQSSHPQQSTSTQLPDSTKQSSDKANQILAKLHAANVKKVTTKLFIQDSRNSVTLSLTSLMTADYVIKALVRLSKLDESPVWTVFEMCNDDGLGETPLLIKSFPLAHRCIQNARFGLGRLLQTSCRPGTLEQLQMRLSLKNMRIT